MYIFPITYSLLAIPYWLFPVMLILNVQRAPTQRIHNATTRRIPAEGLGIHCDLPTMRYGTAEICNKHNVYVWLLVFSPLAQVHGITMKSRKRVRL